MLLLVVTALALALLAVVLIAPPAGASALGGVVSAGLRRRWRAAPRVDQRQDPDDPAVGLGLAGLHHGPPGRFGMVVLAHRTVTAPSIIWRWYLQ